MFYIQLVFIEIMILIITMNGCKASASEQSVNYAEVIGVSNIVPITDQYYTIDSKVAQKGNYYVFQVKTSSGKSYNVTGITNLITTCKEISIIENYLATPSGNQVWKGVKDSTKGIGKGCKTIFVHPGDASVETGHAIGRVGRKLGRGIIGIFKRSPKSSTGKNLAKKGDGITGEQIRDVAYELNLDAYSKNPLVQKTLSSIALKRWWGTHLVIMPMSAGQVAPLFAMLAISLDKNNNKTSNTEILLKNYPPSEVNLKLKKAMADKLGINIRSKDFSPVSSFLANPNYTPRQKAYSELYLQDFIDRPNIMKVIDTLASADNVADAELMFYQLQLLHTYNSKSEKLKGFRTAKSRITGILPSGATLIILPYDYIDNTKDIRKELSPFLSDSTGAELWLIGSASRSFQIWAAKNGIDAIHSNIFNTSIFN